MARAITKSLHHIGFSTETRPSNLFTVVLITYGFQFRKIYNIETGRYQPGIVVPLAAGSSIAEAPLLRFSNSGVGRNGTTVLLRKLERNWFLSGKLIVFGRPFRFQSRMVTKTLDVLFCKPIINNATTAYGWKATLLYQVNWKPLSFIHSFNYCKILRC